MVGLKNLIMEINYNNRRFKPLKISINGDVDKSIIFNYKQKGDLLTCHYKGGSIIAGHLIGKVAKDGIIEMFYHQILQNGEIKAGKCISIPELLGDGRIRLIENWQWLTGDKAKGKSVLVEIPINE